MRSGRDKRRRRRDATCPEACVPGLVADCEACVLADARPGDALVVTGIHDERARVTATRFGMAEGAQVHCVVRIPAGPIVLRSGRQEIAVGRSLAQRISVRHVDDAPPEARS